MVDTGETRGTEPSPIEGQPLSGLLWRGGAAWSRKGVVRVIAPALAAWVPLFVLAAFGGTALRGVELPLLADYVPYARFLLAVPLMLAAERLVDNRTQLVVRYLGTSGIIGPEHQVEWNAALGKMTGIGDSRLSGPAVIVAAWAVSLLGLSEHGHFTAVSSSWYRNSAQELTAAGWYYVLISLPIYLVLFYRWLWRATIWTVFLGRIARMPMRIQPTHPDLCGGLGILWRGQTAFLYVALAAATAAAGNLAHDIVYEGSSLSAERLNILGFILLALALVFAPLFFFTPQLVRIKERALADYAKLGDSLSEQFRQKWLGDAAGNSRLLDSADASAVADYGATYEAAAQMRVVPIRRPGLIYGALLLCMPFAVLPLLEMPVADLIDKVISIFK